MLYKLHTDYFLLCESVILSVLSHIEIYLNICRNVSGVLTFVIQRIYIYIYMEKMSTERFKLGIYKRVLLNLQGCSMYGN